MPSAESAQQSSAAFEVSLANQQTRHSVDEQQLIAATMHVLQDSQFTSANISLAIVDDFTIHELNRRYLDHDWPTDVLSFVLDDSGEHLEGEVVLSADTAAAEAAEFGWPASAEQLLYVIHGTLHLVGYRDKTPEEIRAMRAAEETHLRRFGIDMPRPAQSSGGGSGSIRTPENYGETAP